jgi:hypothetical protein
MLIKIVIDLLKRTCLSVSRPVVFRLKSPNPSNNSGKQDSMACLQSDKASKNYDYYYRNITA